MVAPHSAVPHTIGENPEQRVEFNKTVPPNRPTMVFFGKTGLRKSHLCLSSKKKNHQH